MDQDQDLLKQPPAQAANSNETETDGKLDSNGAAASRDISMTKMKIMKNVLVMSLGFLFLFTAYQSMANLQTSLNKEGGVGAYSLAAIFIALIVSSIFLPKFLMGRVGCKWTIPISMVGYAVYMAVNLYPDIWLMTIAGAILGVGAAPLWTAKCTFLTQLGVWYAKITKESEAAAISKFFGMFFMIFQSSQIWGNLVSSTVLEQMPELNETDNDTAEALCGADFDPSIKTNQTGFTQPPDLVRTLFIIYLCLSVAAMVLVSLLLDPIKLDKETSAEDRKLSPKLLIATLKQLVRSPAQMLLVPLTFYRGVEEGFLGADFTQSYVSCTLGVNNVGYIFICYGVSAVLFSYTPSRLVQYAGHVPFFILASVTHGSILVILLLWTPDAETPLYFYIVGAFWGMADAIMQTQLNALYGALFTEKTEAAFSNYRLWESTGFMVSYLYNDSLVTRHKLYVCLTFLAAGMLGYIVVEVIERRRRSKKGADVTEEVIALPIQDRDVVS